MLRASWKSLLARKVRLIMSGFAIILGVAFVAGSLVFTDTLGKAFDGITNGSVGDVVVRPVGSGGTDGGGTSATIPENLVETLRSTPGAERVDGNIFNVGTFVVSEKGKLVGGQGAPGIASNYTDGPAAGGVESVVLDAGRWPTADGEVVLDPGTSEEGGYLVGEQVALVSSGPVPQFQAKLVGLASPSGGSLVGASLSIFETRTAQRLFLDGENAYNDVWVTAAAGTSQAELRDEVASGLPESLEAVTGDAAAAESASAVNEALGFINTFLLVFAGIALVVGSFLIVNTFSILVAQRSRELALYRALGAGRRQVGRSVLFEALAVGLVGSAVGLLVGVGLAQGIKALFSRFGLDIGQAGLVLLPRTVLVAFAVGVFVTLLAAYLPARRAGAVPPVAAMRDDVVVAEGGLHRRVGLGLVLIAVGVGLLGAGLFLSVPKPTYWVAGGILAVLLGVALTSPLVGRPVVSGLGAIYRRLFGAVGRMAEQNALRNPRRTAATASALMIGVTLVSMMAVFGASAKASVDKAIDGEFIGDYVVSSAFGQGFSPAVTDAVQEVPGVAHVARFRYAPVTIDEDDTYAAATDPGALADVGGLSVVDGSLAGLGAGEVLVSTKRAADDGLAVGDVVTAANGGASEEFTVAGTFKPSPVIGTDVLFDLDGFTALKVPAQDSYAYVERGPSIGAAEVKAGLDKALADLPTVTVKDQAAFAEEQRAPIDQLLYLIYALLGLAVVIAVLGIVNTLALSVIERTREIGLLRAVGLSRRQLRTMLRLEAIVIALLGAALGVGLGLAFGVSLQRSLSDDGIDVLAVPFGQLAVFVLVAGVVGVLAAMWPGRRAARLDVLRAVTTE